MSTTRTILFWLLALVFLGSGVLGAQEPKGDQRLVPLFFSYPVPGAYDSLWVTDLTVTNPSNELIGISSILTDCQFPGCVAAIPAFGTVFAVPLFIDSAGGGKLMDLNEPDVNKLVWSLQVRDVSRGDTHWGVQIPVVHREEAAAVLHLQNVPTDLRYRALLRLYDFDQAPLRPVTIRYYAINPDRRGTGWVDGDELLLEEEATLTWSGDSYVPGQAAIPVDLTRFESVRRLRIEVETTSCESCLWGMVSVTNNDTQHVTIISPAN